MTYYMMPIKGSRNIMATKNLITSPNMKVMKQIAYPIETGL